MSKGKSIILATVALLLSLSLLASSCARTAGVVKPEDFYKGKTLDFTVPSSPGGGTDLQGRLWAEYLRTALQASAVPVENRRAAGGVEGYMHVWNAEKDGLHLGNGLSLVITGNQIMQVPGASYEATDFSYIYSIGAEPFFCVVSTKVQSFADWKAGKGLKFAGASLGGTATLGAVSVIDVLGLDALTVTGFEGSTQAALSIQQGESQGRVGPLSTVMQAINAGQVKALFVLGAKRSPALPDVPTLGELTPLTGENKWLIETFWGEMYPQSYPVFASPGIPKDRLEYLRKAADGIAAQPDFRSKITKAKGYDETAYIPGAQIEKQIRDTMGNKAKIKQLFDALQKKYIK